MTSLPHGRDVKDADFGTCPPEMNGGTAEVCEQFMNVCLQEQRKLQDMVHQFHARYISDMDRCHHDLHVIAGRLVSQQATFQSRRDNAESVNLIPFERMGSGLFSDGVGMEMGRDVSGFSSRISASTVVSHRTTDEISKDRKKHNINVNYHELEERSNKNIVRRVRKSVSRTRRLMFGVFAKRFLGLDCLYKFVNGTFFTSFFACLIVFNAIVIGFTTNYELEEAFDQSFGRSTTGSSVEEDFLRLLDIVFTTLFCIELSLKLAALEFRFFFMADWKWNILDFVLVLISIIETILANSSLQLSYIRILRLCRVLRMVRVVREVPFFEKLRMMMNAVANSVASLVWALVLLFFSIYMFSCVFLQGATQYILNSSEGHDTHIEVLAEFFPNMHGALLTLFMAVTSGISWWEVEEVLLEVGWVYGALFVMYIAVMILALLNIVTGIFLNDALEMAAMDQELQKKFELEKRAQMADELRDIFSKLDTGDSGTITFDEFERFMGTPGASSLFSVFGLNIVDAVPLFDALDVDENRELGIEEFVMGCIQLQGEARTVDLVTHMRENKKIMQRASKAAQSAEQQLRELRDMLSISFQSHHEERSFHDTPSEDVVKEVDC